VSRRLPIRPKAKRRPPPIERALSRDELAEELDLHPDSIKRHHTRDNPPPHDREGQRCVYNAAEYRAWMDEEGLTGERGGQREDSADLEAARLRKENALAAKYELQVEKERGLVVDRAAYRTEWITRIAAAKNKLIGMPAQIAPALIGLDAGDIEHQLRDRVEQIIREIQVGDLDLVGKIHFLPLFHGQNCDRVTHACP
jgi:hypothetical protein